MTHFLFILLRSGRVTQLKVLYVSIGSRAANILLDAACRACCICGGSRARFHCIGVVHLAKSLERGMRELSDNEGRICGCKEREERTQEDLVEWDAQTQRRSAWLTRHHVTLHSLSGPHLRLGIVTHSGNSPIDTINVVVLMYITKLCV
jgi:hypothetical protein